MAAAHILQRKRAVAVLFLTLFVEEENRPKKRNRQLRERLDRSSWRKRYLPSAGKRTRSPIVLRTTGLFSLDERAIFVSRGKIETINRKKKEQPLPLNNVRSTIKPDELNWRETFSSQSQAFFSRFVAWQVAAVVVVRATNPKFVAKSRSQVYFAQHVAACNIEILLSVQVGGNTCNKTFQLATLHCCATSCKEMLPVLLHLNWREFIFWHFSKSIWTEKYDGDRVKRKKLNVLYYWATTTACELLEIHPAGLLSILLRNQVQRFHRNFVSKEERLRKEKESKLRIN